MFTLKCSNINEFNPYFVNRVEGSYILKCVQLYHFSIPLSQFPSQQAMKVKPGLHLVTWIICRFTQLQSTPDLHCLLGCCSTMGILLVNLKQILSVAAQKNDFKAQNKT